MTDPVGAHITRIFVNCPRSSPSPIRSTKSAPVCTSTPITNGNQLNQSPQEKMALIAKQMINAQRSNDVFNRKLTNENFQFVSKQTRQTIDFNLAEPAPKPSAVPNEKTPKKKKKRQTLAVVPPTIENGREFFVKGKLPLKSIRFVFLLVFRMSEADRRRQSRSVERTNQEKNQLHIVRRFSHFHFYFGRRLKKIFISFDASISI